MGSMRILCVGDVVGSAGCAMFQKHIQALKQNKNIDVVIVNGENSSRGRGITSKIVNFFRHCGADVVTTGNHIWHDKEIYGYLSSGSTDLLRPINFPSVAPGVGYTTFTHKSYTVGVVNVQGRVFMREHLDCPFKAMDSILTFLKSKTNIIIVDFHAETTSEKMAMGHYLDGRVSAVVGTHTHVQTADERILPGGTAFMTDLGMAGVLNGMLGMKKEPIVENFLTQMPVKFVVDTAPPYILSGALIDVDTFSGKATGIVPVRIIDNELHVEPEEKSKS